MSSAEDNGVLTPNSNELLEKDNGSLDNGAAEQEADLPKKPASAYVVVSILCMFVAFGGFVFGWDTGTISGFVNMTDFIERFGQTREDGTHYLSDVRTGLMVSIFNIGCAIGGIFLSKFGEVYGRRVGLMITMLVYIVGIIIQIASVKAWYQYFIGRIISGLAVGSVSVLCPIFIAETSPKHIRGTLVSCYQLMITMGIFLGYCTTYGTKQYSNSVQWRVPLGLCFAWALLMITGMVFMPESPRFLVQKGRLDQARKSLAQVNKVSPDDPAIYAEVEAISAAIEVEESAGNAGWGELFTGKPKIFFRLLTGMLMQSLQQLTGDNYFFYYGTTIFNAVGMNDSFQTSIVLGIVNFASTFVALYAVEKLGRRLNLMIGSAGTTVCFVIFASLGVKNLYPEGRGHPEVSDKPVGNAMIFLACLFIFFFAISWAPTTFVVCSEIYPLRIKEKGMALASACNWIWGFLISFFTPFITSAIGFAYGYVFMGCLVFSFFFVYFCIPETKGLSLEEVDELYASGVMPWKSAGWKPSAEYTQHVAYNKAKSHQVEHASTSDVDV